MSSLNPPVNPLNPIATGHAEPNPGAGDVVVQDFLEGGQLPGPLTDPLTNAIEDAANDQNPAADLPEGAIDPTLTPEQIKGRIEAILFLTHRPLPILEIAHMAQAGYEDTEMALMELIQDYGFREGCALEIDDSDGYILQVRQEFSRVVHRMVPVDISAAALRTLSAIALKGPVLQSDLITMRGASAYEHIHELLAKKMISKKRKGRSYMLNVTTTFHEHFKLTGDKKELSILVEASDMGMS